MPRIFAAAIAVALAAPMLSAPAPAAAQDDWDVKRDPFDRRLVARFKGMLKRNPADKFALGKLTNLYQRYRSIKLLIGEYQAHLRRHPKDFSAHVVLGHLLLSQNKRDEALASYEKAAALKPKAAAVQSALGDMYRRAGQNDKAKQAYATALASTRSTALKKQLLRSLADLALAGNDIDGARGYYQKYIKLDPKNLRARIDLGDALVRYKKYKEAIAIFLDAEKRAGRDLFRRIEIVQRIGSAHEASGKDDDAIKEYRRAIKLSRNAYYVRKEMTARIIDIYRKRQTIATLIQHYEKTWKVRSRKHFEWDTLARLYEETGASDKAIAAYRQAVKKNKLELDTHRRLIALLENSGREDEALAQYERVIKIAPGEPRFQLELAQRYWRRGKEKAALQMLKKMERQFSRDGAVYSAIAELYTRWGKEDQALAAHIKLTKIEPGDVSHLVNLGVQYFQRNKKKQAVAVWKRIIKNKTADNYARLGEVYAEHDMLIDALKMYNQAIRMDGKNPERYKGRAGVFERQRRLPQAIADWEKVLSLTKPTATSRSARREARRRIVSLLRRGGTYGLSQRMAQWRSKFAATPPDLEAGYFLIEAHLRAQSWDKARDVLVRMLEVGPKDPKTKEPKDTESMEQLVRVYRYLANYDEAVKWLKRLAIIHPNRQRQYYTMIADIKKDDKKDVEALNWARKALANSPNDPQAHLRLAELYAEMQDFDRAIKSYEKSIALSQRNFKAYFALARLYEARNPKRTAQLYREVLKRSTDNDVLDRAARAAITVEEMNGTLGELERVLAPLAFTSSHKKIYRQKLVELYARYVPMLVRARRLGDARKRAEVNKELERLGNRGLKPLLEALSDEQSPDQQRIAVEVLGYLRNKAAAAPLVRLASQKPKPSSRTTVRGRHITLGAPVIDVELRVKALIAAGRLGDPRTIPQLLSLRSDRSGPMREAAVFALGMTAHKKAVPVLIEALDDALPSVQTLACLGLARTGAKNAIAKMIAVMRDHDRRDPARSACAFGLGYMRARPAVAALLKTLEHGNDDVQRLAAWSLGRIGDQRALAPLLSIYFTRHARVRDAVAWALAALTSKLEEHKVYDFSGFPTRVGKYDAERMVSRLPGKLDAVPALPTLIVGHESALREGIESSLDRHRDLVLRILSDLNRRPDHLALGQLTDRIDSTRPAMRRKIESAVARIGVALLPKLEKLLDHPDAKVRQTALLVIAKVTSPRVSGILLKSLGDGRDSVRKAAMEAAATYVRRKQPGASKVAAQLAAKLQARGWRERLEAARALGLIGKPVQTQVLLEALDDPNGMVREEAAMSLGLQKATAAVTALSRAAADPLRTVRLRAVAALDAIGDAKARAALASLATTSPHAEVKRAARRLSSRRP